MKTAVLAASGLLIAIGSVPYLIETLRGTAKPQVVSWAVWAALLAIGSAAALSSGQVPAAVYGALCAAVDALVAVLALRGADLAFRRLDFLCLAGAVAGLVLLATVRAPAAAVAVSLAADLIAYIPTIVHAWREPHEETWSAYALYAAVARAACGRKPPVALMVVAGVGTPDGPARQQDGCHDQPKPQHRHGDPEERMAGR